MQPTLDPDILSQWIGREKTLVDTLHLGPANLMAMTLDRAPKLALGDVLPPLWHWLYFLQSAPLSALGRDGHPARGGFLPPVALPRRMWAGGRFGFDGALHLGAEGTKRSVIKDVVLKVGRSGALCFVTVRHDISGDGEPAFWEEHDIVYREDPTEGAKANLTAPVGDDWEFTETINPTEVMLFRYSALTFNGHRIHYDRDYSRSVEGHAGLVVHGPLIATLLMDMAQRIAKDAAPRGFDFRAASPLFDGTPFTLHANREGNTIKLVAATPDGRLAMKAEAHF